MVANRSWVRGAGRLGVRFCTGLTGPLLGQIRFIDTIKIPEIRNPQDIQALSSSANSIPVFHLGLPKTGTTTLQTHLFKKHSEIFYLGKYREHTERKGCRTQGIFQFLSPQLWAMNEPLDIEEHRAIWLQEIFCPATDSGHKQIVGSWEGLGNQQNTRHRLTLEKLASTIGGYKVIYVLRNPLSQLPSHYLQELKGGYIKKNKAWSDRGFVSVDEWFTLRMQHSNILNYTSNIRDAIELLGKSNVGVFLYEELRENPEKYYLDICDFIQIDPAEGVKLTENTHQNPRLSTAQYDLLKSGSSRVQCNTRGSSSSSRRRKQLAELSDKGEPVKIALSPANQAIINEQTHAGHNWLAGSLGLPLKEYGYPL